MRAGAARLECYASLNAQAFYTALGFAAVEAFDVALDEDVILSSVHAMVKGANRALTVRMHESQQGTTPSDGDDDAIEKTA